VLVKHAKELAADAAERQVTCQHLRAQLAEILNRQATSWRFPGV
jgi:hypothetical protein